MTEQNNQPVKEFSAGGIQAAIWKNETQREGRTVVQYSVKIQKRFRDKQTNEWRTTEYFYQRDLANLILVAHKAFEFVSLKESKDADDAVPV